MKGDLRHTSRSLLVQTYLGDWLGASRYTGWKQRSSVEETDTPPLLPPPIALAQKFMTIPAGQKAFPAFHGVIFWQDFVQWRTNQNGFASQSENLPHNYGVSTAAASKLPSRAAQILLDA